jgi:hypothetical protein
MKDSHNIDMDLTEISQMASMDPLDAPIDDGKPYLTGRKRLGGTEIIKDAQMSARRIGYRKDSRPDRRYREWHGEERLAQKSGYYERNESQHAEWGRIRGAPSKAQRTVDAQSDGRRDKCCRGVERIRAGGRATAFFQLAAPYRFCGDQGTAGSQWSSPWPEARREACAGP